MLCQSARFKLGETNCPAALGRLIAALLLATRPWRVRAGGPFSGPKLCWRGSGAFLAAMSAQNQRDMRAAAGFYRDLLRTDPANPRCWSGPSLPN
jgi:hypothetical protein